MRDVSPITAALVHRPPCSQVRKATFGDPQTVLQPRQGCVFTSATTTTTSSSSSSSATSSATSHNGAGEPVFAEI